ncbi:DUF1476 domain-containing protein [Pelagibacterium montanilacus]|uniref:DUF1476 domain-containing protein n=1 Tax=Pelagibacterium montanilacus TaxID=2185280 RepID=UPI000F8D27DC|nr:DUF1476 domain-containing protein [Pelagibacterium montanilacus]
MSSFDDRKRAEESKFAHDAELRFKAEARRNKHLAYWACDQLGIEGADERANYVAEVIAADMTEAGPADVVRKLKADFEARNVAFDEAEIARRVDQFDAQAKQEVLAGS